MRRFEEKLVPSDAVAGLSARLRSQKKRIISTNGCFDILHVGHIEYLAEARRLGDVLVVGVNSDSSVRGLKGDGRPIQAQGARAIQVAGLESVDFVVVFDEPTPEVFLEDLRPAIHVKGGDYRIEDLPERAVVEHYGGEVRCLQLVPGFSTSQLIGRLSRPEF